MAYADVKKLTRDDIHTDKGGEMWIIDNRPKLKQVQWLLTESTV